jgi:hypothetical protein
MLPQFLAGAPAFERRTYEERALNGLLDVD